MIARDPLSVSVQENAELRAALKHAQDRWTAAEQRARAMEDAYRREIRRALPPVRREPRNDDGEPEREKPAG